ncbi:MAG: hypothetical protein WB610_04635, partial [Rhodomicrobium sp.]
MSLRSLPVSRIRVSYDYASEGAATLRFAAHVHDKIGVLAGFAACFFIGDDQRGAGQQRRGNVIERF